MDAELTADERETIDQNELDFLRAENQRMKKVVDAAIQWREVTKPDDCSMDEAIYVCDQLLEALAEYESKSVP